MKPDFYLEVMHAEGCIGHLHGGEGCTCTPRLRLHNDPSHFRRSEARNRRLRRAAAREAAKAMRRAKGQRQ